MKKFLRKWLGIESVDLSDYVKKECNRDFVRESINEIFERKKVNWFSGETIGLTGYLDKKIEQIAEKRVIKKADHEINRILHKEKIIDDLVERIKRKQVN